MAQSTIFVIALSAVLFGSFWFGEWLTAFSKTTQNKILSTDISLAIKYSLAVLFICFFTTIFGEPQIGFWVAVGTPIVNLSLFSGLSLIIHQEKIGRFDFRQLQILLFTLSVIFILILRESFGFMAGLILILVGSLYLILEAMLATDTGLLQKIKSFFEMIKNFFSDKRDSVSMFYLFSGGILIILGSFFLVNSFHSVTDVISISEVVFGSLILPVLISLPRLIFTVRWFKTAAQPLSNLTSSSIIDLTFGLGIVNIFSDLRLDRDPIYILIGATALTASSILLFSFVKPFRARIAGLILLILYLVFISTFLVAK